MRIAWFTPFSKKSSIGKFSRSVTEELIKKCEIDLWVPKDSNLLSTDLPVVQFDSVTGLKRLDEYDFTVYNMGDHYGFHKDIYEVSKKYKGIIILHDHMLHHFFHYYYLVDKRIPDIYVKDMRFLYGDNGEKVALAIVRGDPIPQWEEKEIMRYPFFEKAIEGAMGVICHSLFLTNKVKTISLSPVRTIRLPFCLSGNPDAAIKLNKKEWGIPEGKLLMLTVGHVNPNKRLEKAIEVIGKNKDLAAKVVYVIIGPYDHNPSFEKTASLVTKYRLQDTIKFLGYQPDDVLRSFLAAAEIFINMRFPVMEGGSASLVEQFLYGKPIIVTNSGHYAELPDDCVVKIEMDSEEQNLLNTLTNLIEQKERRIQIGQKGKEYAIENCSVSKYCTTFIDFIHSVSRQKPLLSLTDRVSEELYSMRVGGKLKVVDDISNEIYNLFC